MLVPGSLSRLTEYLSMDGILGQVGYRQFVPIKLLSRLTGYLSMDGILGEVGSRRFVRLSGVYCI